MITFASSQESTEPISLTPSTSLRDGHRSKHDKPENRVSVPANRIPTQGAAEGRQSDQRRMLVEAIQSSKVFKDYQKAFLRLTGLPLALQTADSWQLPHHGNSNENPFCAALARQNGTCAACLEMKAKLYQKAKECAQTEVCPFGLSESAVPLRVGSEIIGYLHTGQTFLKKPQTSHFKKIWARLSSLGHKEKESLEKDYFNTRVTESKNYESMIAMLEIFVQHIGNLANQIALQNENSENPVVARAKAYVQEHQTEEFSLDEVAKSLHISPFYFCKVFKKGTGLTFTDYVSRVRIEKGKNLLLNPRYRISEIAYEIGFQSLTHFNRVFKKLVGQSPTEFRLRLASAR
jgi:AraC-like DNA-binding protein